MILYFLIKFYSISNTIDFGVYCFLKYMYIEKVLFIEIYIIQIICLLTYYLLIKLWNRHLPNTLSGNKDEKLAGCIYNFSLI